MLTDNSIDIDLNLLIDIEDIPSKDLDKLEPMNTNIVPWLYECKKGFNNDLFFIEGRGKWMLFFDKQLMNSKWKLCKELFRSGYINNIEYIKCSTNYQSERATSNNYGLISFYCNNSDNKEKILEIGNNLVKIFKYDEMDYIYYKTDMLSKNGCRNNGKSFNYLYKLHNNLYIGNEFID